MIDAHPSGAPREPEQSASRSPHGRFDATMTLRIDGPLPHAPLLVRPVVEDTAQDWLAPLSAQLPLSPRRRIGITAADTLMAAKIACDLAAWVAGGRRRVVVVDCSVECPAIAKPVRGDRHEGLVDVVAYGVSVSLGVKRTLAAGVSLMTSGSHPLSAEEVFTSERFPATLRDLSESGALVFLVVGPQEIAYTLPFLDAVLAVGRSVDELRSLGRLLEEHSPDRELGRVAVLLSGANEEEAMDSEKEKQKRGPGKESEPAAPHRNAEPTKEGRAVSASETRPEAPVTRGWRAQRRPRGRGGRAVGTIAAAVVIVVAVIAFFALRGGRTATETGRAAQEAAVRVAELIESRKADGEPLPEGTEHRAVPSGRTEGSAPVTAGEETRRAAQEPAEAPHAREGDELHPEEGEAPPAPARASAPTPPRLEGFQGPLFGPGGAYRVFASSHYHESAARADVSTLSARGVQAEAVEADLGERGIWHRVSVVGGFPSTTAAHEIVEILNRLGYAGAWIERVPVDG